jgi:hypothetical protein
LLLFCGSNSISDSAISLFSLPLKWGLTSVTTNSDSNGGNPLKALKGTTASPLLSIT